jgi:CheY-like chemotaxis protein
MNDEGGGRQVDILIVEDNADDVELTLHALRENNLANRVEIARDGRAALDFVFCEGAYAERAIEDRPQLILLDLKLPKVPGLDVLRAIKGDPRTKTIPVVVLTSSREDRDIIESYDVGVNSYIQKPVSFAELTTAVAQLGLYWMILNVGPPR